MTQEAKARRVRKVDLEYPIHIKPQSSRPIFKRTNGYTIILYEEYAGLVACQLCNSKEKTGSRVVIRDEVTKETFVSGMDCLKKNTGVTAAHLNVSSQAIRRLTRTWQDFAEDISPEYADAESTNEALERMSVFLESAVSFNCPAVKHAISFVRRLREDTASVTERSWGEEMEVLETFIRLQQMHRQHSQRFADLARSLKHHPRTRKAEAKLFNHFFSTLEQADWQAVRDFHKTLRRVRGQKTLNLKNTEVPSTHFPDKQSYLSGLGNYMVGRVNRLDDSIDILRPNRFRLYK